MKVSIDTNILIDTPQIVFDTEREFVLSFTVIRELDNLKRNPDLKRAAQTAIKNIWYLFKDDKIEILNVPNLLGESPDEKIIQDTKDADAMILSNDIAVRIIAKAHGIPISDFEAEDDIDYDYKGYQYVETNTEYTKTYHSLKDIPVEEFCHYMGCELKENEYVIVEDGTDNPDIWKNIEGTVYRISQKMNPFTEAGVTGVQPLDPVQMCVLDAVLDPVCALTVVDGIVGTGKTMLSIMSALAAVKGRQDYMFYDRIVITASPESINKNLYTGFKPGETESKLGGHLGGFKSNLKFLLDPKKAKTGRKGKKEDKENENILKPSDYAWEEFFEIVEMDEVQGTSYHNAIILVDEWQKLDEDTLKTIITRVSENSKIVLMGDTSGQVYGLNRGNEGFKRLYKHLGKSKHMNFLKMENIYRSPLVEFAEEVFHED